jgi:hypothetical protein
MGGRAPLGFDAFMQRLCSRPKIQTSGCIAGELLSYREPGSACTLLSFHWKFCTPFIESTIGWSMYIRRFLSLERARGMCLNAPPDWSLSNLQMSFNRPRCHVVA